MFAAIDHSSLGLLMDPTNYFEAHNIGDMDGELNRVFNALASKIKIAHAKDVKLAGADKSEKHAELFDGAAESHTFRGVGQIELPAPGLGSLNYDLYLRRLAEHHPNIPIIIEHLDESDVPRAKTVDMIQVGPSQRARHAGHVIDHVHSIDSLPQTVRFQHATVKQSNPQPQQMVYRRGLADQTAGFVATVHEGLNHMPSNEPACPRYQSRSHDAVVSYSREVFIQD